LQTRSEVNNGCKNFPRLEKSPFERIQKGIFPGNC
jgi:hypothetical protein